MKTNVFRVLSARNIFSRIWKCDNSHSRCFIFLCIMAKSNYIWLECQITWSERSKKKTNEPASLVRLPGQFNIALSIGFRVFNRKLNDIWIVYLELIHFACHCWWWRVKVCLWQWKRLYILTVIVVFGILCGAERKKRAALSPFGRSVRTGSAPCLFWLSFLCASFRSFVVVIFRKTEWFIIYPVEISLELALCTLSIHYVTKYIQIQIDRLFFALFSVFTIHNTHARPWDNVCVEEPMFHRILRMSILKFTVKYLWVNICASHTAMCPIHTEPKWILLWQHSICDTCSLFLLFAKRISIKNDGT